MAADTIFALATGAGRSAVAVIRLSGPNASASLRAFAGLVPEPKHAHFARFRDPQTNETLDRGLALWFPGPSSATGEDCVEFHLHGSRAVVDAILTLLARQTGLRPAEPGEFARRAFINGKMDLSQAEALADLIDAQTAFQRRQALRLSGGALRRQVGNWRAALIDASALVAAELDFSDEGDVGAFSPLALEAILRPVVARMDEVLRLAPASERLRDGFLVLILGPPNAGKSTLLNRLARREIAIVSELPGTTRDMIEVELDLSGVPVTLVDTAGMRETEDAVERIGVMRARARAFDADLLLWLSEGGAAPAPDVAAAGVEILRIATKADEVSPRADCLAVSARTGFGVDDLCNEIAARGRAMLGDGASALVIRERHRECIGAARKNLEAAVERGKPLEIVAEDLRLAGRALERIVGAIDVEQVLDAIFSRFCIGK
ncbi:MAG: tRNA uridine-5-carboxymethylaminomethyl(34) synthesis GTPase MnmE [Methylocystis sp.]